MTSLPNSNRISPLLSHIQQANPEDDRPVSISARLGRLQFHNSGKFRLLQLADIQDGPKVDVDTIKLISAAVDAARPDLVVFTGNQIAGYNDAYAQTFRKRRWEGKGLARLQSASRQSKWMEAKLGRTTAKVRATISQFITPLVQRTIPWVVTYGNHDFQCGLSNARMDVIYREFAGCLNPKPGLAQMAVGESMPAGPMLPDQLVYPCQPGTFALPVMDETGSHAVLGLTLVDSGDYAREGGYGSPSDQALDFLRQVPALLQARSMAFQHFALPQYYRLLKEVHRTAANAVEGYRTFSGHTYVLDESTTLPGSYLGEGISCPDHDNGEFDLLRQDNGYFAIASGHDHRNWFVGEVEGLTLVATPTCGLGSYGPAPTRCAARLFEFDIRHPHQPRTQLLSYGDLLGKPGSHKAYTYALNSESSSKGETMDLLRRASPLDRLFRRLFAHRK